LARAGGDVEVGAEQLGGQVEQRVTGHLGAGDRRLVEDVDRVLAGVLVPSVSGLRTRLPRVSGVPTLASFSSVWSSTGAWLPPEQEDQFFQ